MSVYVTLLKQHVWKDNRCIACGIAKRLNGRNYGCKGATRLQRVNNRRELDKAYERRNARKKYYRRMEREGKVVKQRKVYVALPLTYKERLALMDEKAAKWLKTVR